MNTTVVWKRISLVMVLVGLVGAAAILIYGENILGTSDGVPWGSLISTYLFFAAASVGLTLMASLWYIFGNPVFEPITKRALYLAIISVLLGFVAIGLELGKPLNLIWILFSPNFSSPIFWMGALYALYLGFRILTVYSLYKQDDKKVLTFSRITVVAGLMAVSNLGSVFGNVQARPFWQGGAMSLYFVLLALLTGTTILIITFAQLDKPKGLAENQKLMNSLGRMLLYFVGTLAFFKFWYLGNAIYGYNPATYLSAKAMLSGSLAFHFWILEVGLAILIPLILLARPSRYTNNKLNWAAMIALIGVFFTHNNFVLAGQLAPLQVVPGTTLIYNSYQAMPAEWAIVIGAIGGLIYGSLWVEKKFFKRATSKA